MERLLGVILIVISAICFGTNVVFARLAYAAGADPLTFLFFRFVLATILMAAIVRIRKKKYPRGRLLGNLVLLGGAGMAISTLFFYYALSMASASLVMVLTYIYPTLVTLLAAVFFKRRITPVAILALLLTFSGMLLTVGTAWQGQLAGILCALSTAVIFSVFMLMAGFSIRKAGTIPASAVITYAAAVVFALGAAVRGLQLPATALGWAAIVISAFVTNGLGGLAFSAGLKRIDSPIASMLSTLEVVVAVMLAMLFLGEEMSLAKFSGAAMILGAAIALAKSEMKPSPAIMARIRE